ncbi:hypothetical protein ABH313_20175 [Chromobacterium vaccinii]|uniref:hypothetical protein n=1 Tax=Chromobacterium vaccinii TaxID=1108595 RepID=UPI0032612AD3
MYAAKPSFKRVIEYPLPASSQTHEVVSIAPDLILISQQPSGGLVKMRVNPGTGRPIESVVHIIDNPFSGLHGLTVSKRHPGCLWVTLQFQSELLLIDPVAHDLAAAPRTLQKIQLPEPARGPHVVAEDGDILWASCKDSHHVARVDTHDPDHPRIIPCPPRPIFVQVHPASGDVYATLDQSSALFRIPADPAQAPCEIAIPGEIGNTPVGMVPGPDGNLWLALLGNASGGNGSFGRILADGEIDWFQLTAGPAKGASFIHLGFSPDPSKSNTIYLLASSMADGAALNGVVQVLLNEDYSQIGPQQTIAFPTQQSMTHRVLCTERSLYATELGACCLAHLAPAFSPYGEGVNEMADAYSLWGCGVPGQTVRYHGPDLER